MKGLDVATLEEVNHLAKYHSDFHVLDFDGCRLIVVGSFDLCYYHHIELHFTSVAHINCPVWFHNPTFRDDGPFSDPNGSVLNPRRFIIHSDEGEHSIIAERVEIVLGTVFYYDRGEQLKPGERIASWVKREGEAP